MAARKKPVDPGSRFVLSESIVRKEHARPYDRFGERLDALGSGERIPVTRPVLVYTQDPGTPRLDVAIGTAAVPFEPLLAGPTGHVVRIIDTDETTRLQFEPLDLDRLGSRAPSGLPPSTGEPQFAQQMTYAVAMTTYDRFRQALGRTPDFSFGARRDGEPDDDGHVKLHVYPHGMKEDNAYYDPERGALLFGYTFASRRATGLNQPGDVIYTGLSHDVIVHEMTHALLDGIRAKFMLPSNPDVDAFHEGFADLVALFQRFQFRDLVKHGIRSSADLDSHLLTDLARQWGSTTGPDPRKALRSALVAAGGFGDPVPPRFRYDRRKEAHDLGAVLVAAVFDAFRWIYGRKTQDLRSVALRPGERPSTELVDLLAEEAVRLSGQFLNVIVRALDYCPPVDVTFGEYLRALVTADFDLVAEDPWGYREALVQAFRRYGIVVDRVPDLSEESLLWCSPEGGLPAIPGLSFPELRHGREPGTIVIPAERRRRALALGEFVTRPAHLDRFGLMEPTRSGRAIVEPPIVESIRTIRRLGPDDSVNFDLVGEVTQRRKTQRGRWFYGGCTVIVDSGGEVRYAIAKHVGSARREAELERHLGAASALHARLFSEDQPRTGKLIRQLHQGKG